MEFFIIVLVALLASGLTLFSGFGLGTLLMPVFALFFPLPVAISLTAVVHLLNNIFKTILLGKYAEWRIVMAFGVPAAIAAYLGAWLLTSMGEFSPIGSYTIAGNPFIIEPVKLTIGILMLIFAAIDLLPKEKLQFPKGLLPVGGLLSGFLGGLSGHQGALRSAFLIRYDLTKEIFIATGVIIAVGIDLSRLFVYTGYFSMDIVRDNSLLLLAAIGAAFTGSYIGSLYLKKTTFKTVQYFVFVFLALIALGLIAGII